MKESKGSVRKRGNGWYYRFSITPKDGKYRQVERYGGKTRNDALKALRNALNLYYNTGTIRKEGKLSANDFFEYWYQNYVMVNLSRNTQSNYRNILDKYVLPKLGIYNLKDLTPATLQKFINDVSKSKEYKPDKTHLSKHTIEIILMVVKEALKYAVYPLQLLDSSPAVYIKMPKIDVPKKTRDDLKIITVKQFSQIVDLFGKDSMKATPFYVAFYTGMRRGEVCGLEWDNVDLLNGEINVTEQMKQFSAHDIRIGKLKTPASNRTIPIGNELVSILKKQRLRQSQNRLRYGKRYYESNFVCTKENGKPITPGSIKYLSSLVSPTLGFPFSFHSLRHTHATLLLEAGATPKEVQVRLGHSKIETTMNTYVHLTDRKKRETAQLFDSIAKL